MDYTDIYNKICQRGLENRKLKPEWGRLEKHHIISPEGKQFNSIAEASYYTGIKRSTLDNWVRRGTNNWKKIPITGRA